MFNLQITNEQAILVRLAPMTDAGKPAKLDGAPKWSVLQGKSTLQASTDGLSCYLIAADNPEIAVFQVDGDADLGDGVTDLQEQITLTVVHANATNLGLANDQPIAKDAVPAPVADQP